MNQQAGDSLASSVFALAAAILLGLSAAMPAHAETRAGAAPVDAPRAATTSFNFNDIPVRSALQLIAEEGRFNLVVSDSVQGTITLHLTDVTWEQALEVVLRLKGLEQRVYSDTHAVTAAGG
jgi:type IV pilus assembly protein PilQ